MKSITKIGLSFDTCMIMAEAAIRKAREIKINIAITFVDESGVLKAFFRIDHSPLVSVDASRKKAITAVGFGIPSGDSGIHSSRMIRSYCMVFSNLKILFCLVEVHPLW